MVCISCQCLTVITQDHLGDRTARLITAKNRFLLEKRQANFVPDSMRRGADFGNQCVATKYPVDIPMINFRWINASFFFQHICSGEMGGWHLVASLQQ